MKPVVIAALVIGAVAIRMWIEPTAAPAAHTSTATSQVAVNVFSITNGSAGVKIQNVSRERLASVFLHCTFRNQYGERIDSVPVFVSNLASGDTANEIARMPNDIKASAVDCRTEHAG